MIFKLRIVLYFLLQALSGFSPLGVCAAGEPNLLIICTDEHNFRTLGCYRELLSEDQAFVWGKGVEVETPHMDSLAQQGAICTSFYGTTPLCAPARASLMTGLYPHATGVPINDLPMTDGLITFAQVLQKRGYATGYFGKWHLDGKPKPGWAPERKFGWEDNHYMYNRGHWKNLQDTPGGPRVNAPSGADGLPTYDLGDADERSYPTDFLTDRTIEFMERNRNRPFCAMLSIPDPHGPDSVRPPYDTMYGHLKFKEPETLFKTDSQTPAWIVGNTQDIVEGQRLNQQDMSGYFGMVKLIDDNVGKLLSYLVKNGLDEKTVVVFLSDHGDLLGEHGRNNKRLPYEGSAISPLIIKYPGKIRPGKVIQSALTTADFAPTILSILGSGLSLGEIHGRDVSSQFFSPDRVVNEPDIIYTRGIMNPTGDRPYWLAALSDRYKLVIARQEPPWLIDLEKDPDELRNFYDAPGYQEISRQFTVQLKVLLEATEDPALDEEALMQWLD